LLLGLIFHYGWSVEATPVSSAINREIPIPTGARNVLLCFSAASIKIVKTSWKVRNISIKRPCTTEVPPPRVVETLRGPGKMHETRAAATIPARICVGISRAARTKSRAPTRRSPTVTYKAY
jgi:hypothetical protein